MIGQGWKCGLIESLFSHDLSVLELKVKHKKIDKEFIEVLVLSGNTSQCVFCRVDCLTVFEFKIGPKEFDTETK